MKNPTNPPPRTATYTALLWLLTTSLAWSQAVSNLAPPTSPNSRTAPPHTRTPIILDQAQPDIFPSSWLVAPVNAQATMLAENERQRSWTIVDQALAKYPPPVLSMHLKKVYVVGRLDYFGVATGGTNSRTAVYLANNGKYRSTAIESVFHAEFSSILLRNHPQHLDTRAWEAINPVGFRYRGNGVKAIQQGQAGQKLDPALHENGFMVEYAMSNLENDFNSIADRLFMGDAAFWRVAEQYPKVMSKTDLAIAFYTKVDPSLTSAFFQTLRKK